VLQAGKNSSQYLPSGGALALALPAGSACMVLIAFFRGKSIAGLSKACRREFCKNLNGFDQAGWHALHVWMKAAESLVSASSIISQPCGFCHDLRLQAR
jgi:hypothetical protein